MDEQPDRPKRTDRRRLDEVFGDVMPDTTADERDPRERADRDDDWYLANRPPHHGGA